MEQSAAGDRTVPHGNTSQAQDIATTALDYAAEQVSQAIDLALEYRGTLARSHREVPGTSTASQQSHLNDQLEVLRKVRIAVRDARHLLPETAPHPLVHPSRREDAGVDAASPITPLPQKHRFDAIEEERQRLVREIHDGPAQVVSNIGLRLDYLRKLLDRDPLRVQEELRDLQEDVKRATSELRWFMYDLVPPGLMQGDVRAAVLSHCERITSRFGLPITVDFDLDPPLTRSQQTAVFRIIQEAVQNVIKHAHATQVNVSGHLAGQSFVVSVRDNGVGLENLEERLLTGHHLGMSSMRARARHIGGTVQFSGAPGDGTTVILQLPCEG